MDMARVFGLPAALLVIAVIANRLSRWTRVPDIIVLLLIGVGLGPILHWVDPKNFSAAGSPRLSRSHSNLIMFENIAVRGSGSLKPSVFPKGRAGATLREDGRLRPPPAVK
jgi:Kef-type K+ transport system membrane component KefB